MKDDKTKNPKR